VVNITINGKQFAVEEGLSVLEAAKQNNILIPSLCYLEDVHQVGACRICVVEIEGARTLQASCMVQVREGMKVRTNTDKVRKARKMLYELMLSDHPRNCLSCFRNQNCEFQRLGEIIQITDFRFEGEKSKTFVDNSSPSIMRDSSKCILCRRCITVCNQVQGVGVLNVQNLGSHGRQESQEKSFPAPGTRLPRPSLGLLQGSSFFTPRRLGSSSTRRHQFALASP
jgi:NADH-quinone oxidoreductase subunit G/NADP-reducing hydrogenase subunit HndD